MEGRGGGEVCGGVEEALLQVCVGGGPGREGVFMLLQCLDALLQFLWEGRVGRCTCAVYAAWWTLCT